MGARDGPAPACELVSRLPDIEVSGEPSHTLSTFFQGVHHLPVRFTPER